MNMRYLILALIISACGSADNDDDWADTPITTDTSATDTNTTDSGTSDTAPQLVLPEDGTWDMTEPQVVSDTCGVGEYQDVLEFVPREIVIANVTEGGFNLDDGVYCDLSESTFSCTTQQIEESALGGTATMMIESTMSGYVENTNLISTKMDVVIESCEGGGCLLIEVALTFPCPIELESNAVKL